MHNFTHQNNPSCANIQERQKLEEAEKKEEEAREAAKKQEDKTREAMLKIVEDTLKCKVRSFFLCYHKFS